MVTLRTLGSRVATRLQSSQRVHRAAKQWAQLRHQRRIALGERGGDACLLGWETVDLLDADHLVDLRDAHLPLADAAVIAAYASHVLEHLPRPSVAKLLAETRRVLRPGGVLRIAVPSLHRIVTAFVEGDHAFFYRTNGPRVCERVGEGALGSDALTPARLMTHWLASYSSRLDTGGGAQLSADEIHAAYAAGGIEAVRDAAVARLEPERVYAHVFVPSERELRELLLDAGFTDVTVARFRESRSPAFDGALIERERHRGYSLYVEAR